MEKRAIIFVIAQVEELLIGEKVQKLKIVQDEIAHNILL